jgi:hypothetical protein
LGPLGAGAFLATVVVVALPSAGAASAPIRTNPRVVHARTRINPRQQAPELVMASSLTRERPKWLRLAYGGLSSCDGLPETWTTVATGSLANYHLDHGAVGQT